MSDGLQLRAEGNKLLHDTMKQLVTISSGSILIIIAVLEKLFKPPRWIFLVAVAFAAFLVCIIASLKMMRTMSLKMGTGYSKEKPEEEKQKRLQKTEDIVYPIAYYSFLSAILALVVFVVVNLLFPLPPPGNTQ